jgi:hypothetical protein
VSQILNVWTGIESGQEYIKIDTMLYDRRLYTDLNTCIGYNSLEAVASAFLSNTMPDLK